MLCNFNIPEMQLTEEAGVLAGSGVHAVDTMNSDQLAANANENKQVFAYRWKVLDFVKSCKCTSVFECEWVNLCRYFFLKKGMAWDQHKHLFTAVQL